MDRINIKNHSSIQLHFASRPAFGQKGSCPIDQYYSQEFNIDPQTGRPMSDITALMRCQNQVEMQAAFAALSDYKSNFLPDDISDGDALPFLKPRLAQMPSELLEWRGKLDEKHLQEETLKQQQEETAKLEKERAEEFENFMRSKSKTSKKVESDG